jgi:GT2 family glycosyltransferase
MNNFAVRQVNSPYILFLNNDTKVISGEWLTAMLEHIQRNDIGAVGAKLLYPDNTVQHAGIIIGLGGIAGHSHKYYPDQSHGYAGRASVIQNVSAVTAACLLTKKELFENIGGFDEDLVQAFNDVDLCLKIREKGYQIIFTPYARLYHYESRTRGYEDSPEKRMRFSLERNLIRQKWGNLIDSGDPFYSPNLTKDREDFSIAV